MKPPGGETLPPTHFVDLGPKSVNVPSSSALVSTRGGRVQYGSHNQIGGAARLAPPRSYRSTSAFEAIRANLAIPLRMALKTRSKLGCQASNLLCSAIPNNANIEGTWFFGGWRLCPLIFVCAHRSVQIQFFGRQKNRTPLRRT